MYSEFVIEDTTTKSDVSARLKSRAASTASRIPLVYEVLSVARIFLSVFCLYIIAATASVLMELFAVCVKHIGDCVRVLCGSGCCLHFLAGEPVFTCCVIDLDTGLSIVGVHIK